MIELVQGLQAIDDSRRVRENVELAKHDAVLIGGALETLPVILQALILLKQRADEGEAEEWQPRFLGKAREQIKDTLDWARRIDWLGVREQQGVELLIRLVSGGNSS